MLMWRAPLKVLVFYDWSDNERKNKPEKARWLRDKLDDLFEMGRQVDNLWPEADKTACLFLVGQSPKRGDLPVWGYLCFRAAVGPDSQANSNHYRLVSQAYYYQNQGIKLKNLGQNRLLIPALSNSHSFWKITV